MSYLGPLSTEPWPADQAERNRVHTAVPYYSNCLLYALAYRWRHRSSRICWHRGRWWRWVPHFYVLDGEQVLDFKSHPARNGTPFRFQGLPRTRTREALQRYLAQTTTQHG